MSSILDALRRLEREQNEPSQTNVPLAPEEPPSRPRRLWLGATAAILVGSIAAISVWGFRRGAVPANSGTQLPANGERETVATSVRTGSDPERRANVESAISPAMRPGAGDSGSSASKLTKNDAAVASTRHGKKTPPPAGGIKPRPGQRDRLRRTRADIERRNERMPLASRLNDTRERVHRDLAHRRPGPATEPPAAAHADGAPQDARPAPAGITDGRIPMRDRLHATRTQAKLRVPKNVIEIPKTPPPAGAAPRDAPSDAASSDGASNTKEHVTTDTPEQEEVLRRPPRGAPRIRVSFLFYSTDPTRRRVMLTIDGGKPMTLFEGQSAESLAIARILPDAVHLRYEGKLFAIRPR